MSSLVTESGFEQLKTPVPMYRGVVDEAGWMECARAMAQQGGRLVAVWGVDRRKAGGAFAICAAYALQGEGLLWVDLPVDSATCEYPDISEIFLSAVRMQRATYDLVGLRPRGAADQRPWLRHGGWPEGYFPLRHENSGAEVFPLSSGDYPFIQVEGEGVHEIPVGPVHAGIIEPGHFRFSIVGEPVIRLEERLGYQHKGIDKIFEGKTIEESAPLAGRVSGDTTVAFAWGYAMAAESALGVQSPERAEWLRALMLERERVANHLGDLAMMGNDVAFAFALAQLFRLKEQWVRLNHTVFGHRFMMDQIIPGGVKTDVSPQFLETMVRQCAEIEVEVKEVEAVYNEHAGLLDRFVTTGRVRPETAAKLGLTGLAGRASGQAFDIRCDYAFAPYSTINPSKKFYPNGDCLARAKVRFEELYESLRLIREIAQRIPTGPVSVPMPSRPPSGGRDGVVAGLGWVEGWRGDILVSIELDASSGRIRRCHCHDPSWQNWPLLEIAVLKNIVPDFPLINKSFNLSYAGGDI